MLSDDIKRETSHMDRITQLQDATDNLIALMFGSVDYLTKKATFKQVSDRFPITQEIPDAEDPATFEANKKQLVEDLLIKAKEMQVLIDALPAAKEFYEAASSSPNQANGSASVAANADDTDPELASLEKEMKAVNQEYLSVLAEAETLQAELKSTIRSMLDEHHSLTSALLAP